MDGLHQICAMLRSLSTYIYIRLNSSLKVARSFEGCDDDAPDVSRLALTHLENV